MIHFLDASALAKRYIREPGSERIEQLFRGRAAIAVSRLTLVEVASALLRRARKGDVDTELVRQHVDDLRDDFTSVAVIESRGAVLQQALQVVEKHALRAYDAVQLASAMRLAGGRARAINFVAADGELCDAAEEEKLRVERLG